MEEFKLEIASLGVPTLEGSTSPPGIRLVHPDRSSADVGRVREPPVPACDNQGLTFKRGSTGGLTSASRAKLGDFLSFHLQPELLENEDYGAPDSQPAMRSSRSTTSSSSWDAIACGGARLSQRTDADQ